MSGTTRASSGEPNRRESSKAIGRAPIARMSRMIPPTPVAAPWNGATALGWLWLSILKTAAHPGATITAPAFSPGPCSTRRPRTGSRASTALECLYAQCSLHITPNIASSVRLGARPRRRQISSYSAGRSPVSARRSVTGSVCIASLALRARSGRERDGGRAPPRGDPPVQGLEDQAAILAAQERLACALGVRHQPDHGPAPAGHPRDGIERPVGVRPRGDGPPRIAIPKRDLPAGDEVLVGRWVGVVVPLGVGDRQPQDLARGHRAREGRIDPLDPDVDELASKLPARVRAHRAGEEPGLEQHLKAVADPEDEPAGRRVLPQRAHDRRGRRDRPRPKIVAVREPAGEDHRVEPGELPLLVPHILRPMAEDVTDGMHGVRVAVAAWEHDDPNVHGQPPFRGCRTGSLRSACWPETPRRSRGPAPRHGRRRRVPPRSTFPPGRSGRPDARARPG